MPVLQPEWDFGLNLDLPYLQDSDLFDSLSIAPLEELWKSELESLTDSWGLQEDSWNPDCKRGATMIRVHDCMWAGTCLSKDHGRKPGQNSDVRCSHSGSSSSCNNNRSNSEQTRVRQTTVTSSTTAATTPASARSLLKKPSIPAPTKVLHRPDTPQSEDECKYRPDDDFYSRGVAVSEITGQRRTETTTAGAVVLPPTNSVSFDHNYNTKKQPKLEDLGIQTPSDSEEEEEESEEEESQSSEVDNEEEEEDDDEEEEIDVVSLKPSSPVRKTKYQHQVEQFRYRVDETRKPVDCSRVKVEEEWRIELSSAEHAVKIASQAISKRLGAQGTRGRGRQKRKRASSDEDETYKPSEYRRTPVGKQPKNVVRRKYSTPSKKTRISTDSETDSTEKRSQHNNMERMRRIDLRNAFEELRSLVPSLVDAARAAKVTILRDAAAYCSQLNSNSKTLASQVSILRREQEKLRTNLSKLRRHIANKHIGGPNNR